MKTKFDAFDWWTLSGMLAFWYGIYQFSPAAAWMFGGIAFLIYGTTEGKFGRTKKGGDE